MKKINKILITVISICISIVGVKIYGDYQYCNGMNDAKNIMKEAFSKRLNPEEES